MLPAWYKRAVNELKTMNEEDINLFRELIQSAKEFSL
jgi:hypothetical protein